MLIKLVAKKISWTQSREVGQTSAHVRVYCTWSASRNIFARSFMRGRIFTRVPPEKFRLPWSGSQVLRPINLTSEISKETQYYSRQQTTVGTTSIGNKRQRIQFAREILQGESWILSPQFVSPKVSVSIKQCKDRKMNTCPLSHYQKCVRAPIF